MLWYNSSISLTLDTISVYVTTYRGLNGSNATAVTKTSTIYGEIDKVNASQVADATSIYDLYVANMVPQYIGGGSIFLARGTDGAVGPVTSLPWPTPYVAISSVAYARTVPYDGCPSGLQPMPYGPGVTGTCGCALNARTVYSDFAGPFSTLGVSQIEIPLPTNFYYPIPTQAYNWSYFQSGLLGEEAILSMSNSRSWLTTQRWATTLIPDLQNCGWSGMPRGPPGVKS